jgi:uncharacterized membrane protein YbhN (UPF0104 family)
VNRQRALNLTILVVGLAALVVATIRSLDDADERVLPGPLALAAAGALALVAVVASGHAWTALFHDILASHRHRVVLRGTYYLSQITKYLPVGGVAQAASQLSLAPTAGVPYGRVALAFPVSAVASVAAGATLGSGVALSASLPSWVRALALCGLAAPVLLLRRPMAAALGLLRRVVRRLPQDDRLPSQRGIVVFYFWALLTIGALSAAYAGLLGSVTSGLNPAMVFCAFALSWVVGFLALPVPAGVGVREAVLVGLIPGAGVAPIVAASLALRLVSTAAELLAIAGNRFLLRRHDRVTVAPEAPTGCDLPAGTQPVRSSRLWHAKRR